MKTHNQILNTPKYVTRILKSIYRPIFGPLIQTNANETVAIFQFKIWSTNELHINTRTFCFFILSPLTEIEMNSFSQISTTFDNL